MAASIGSIVISLRAPLASLFVADDHAVVEHIVALMPLTTLYSMLATLAPGWSQQVLFGLGASLRIPAALNFVCFFALGLPLGTVLAFSARLGARGLWAGLDVAILLIVIGQYIFIYCAVDWEKAAANAREKALSKMMGGGGEAGAHADGQGLAATDSAALQTWCSDAVAQPLADDEAQLGAVQGPATKLPSRSTPA